MKSETCFSASKMLWASLVLATALVSTHIYKMWSCPAPTPVAIRTTADPLQVCEGKELGEKMDHHTQLILSLHHEMDEVNTNLTEIQVLLSDN